MSLTGEHYSAAAASEPPGKIVDDLDVERWTRQSGRPERWNGCLLLPRSKPRLRLLPLLSLPALPQR